VLKPEPMRHLTVVMLTSDLERTARTIARHGVLHLLDIRQWTEAAGAVRPLDVEERLRDVTEVADQLTGLAELLGLPRQVEPEGEVREGPVELAPVRERAAAIGVEVRAVAQRRAELEHAAAELIKLQGSMRALAGIGLPIERLRDLRYVYLVSGLLPARNARRLRESAARIPHLLMMGERPQPDARVLATALTLRADQDAIDRALRSVQFEPVPLPQGVTGTPADVSAEIDRQLEEARERLAAVDAERKAIAERYGEELANLRRLVWQERLLVEARGRMGASERVAVVAGWVPAVLARRLEEAIRAVLGERCVLEWRDPVTLDDVRRGRIPVPILLRNPALIRPFERLVRNYGLPRYTEIEPTAVVALAFLTMFGFMFGDVGQGLVLFAIGYFMYRRMFRYRDYALILMECGVFATLFGFLYGSVFGVERWLPALWLRPMEDMQQLMRTAIAFGVVFLSLGLILNLVNAMRARDAAALWGRNGLLFAVGYWTAVGLAIRRVWAGPDAVGMGTALVWLVPPLTLILLREPVGLLWKATRDHTWPGVAEIMALMVQSVVEVLDAVVGAIANTATFIRLAAFALAHAGLFLATFSVADALARTSGGTVGAVVAIVVGNVVIIALEGLIVSIQSIRLEYYEFFSKFYSGGGEEYRPLRLASSGTVRA
jgi:V/A-type H+-transporting ATPase subunit I